MNCEEARRHWDLYYDSEGDSELYLQINDHLAQCSRCAEWFYRQGQFEDLLVARLQPAQPTAELWQRIHGQCGLVRPAGVRSWLFFSTWMALAASLLLIVGLWWISSNPNQRGHLTKLTTECHQRLIGGQERIDFSSRSDRAVEDYLRRQVPFPVRCPPRQDAGFIVRGGGVCDVAGELVAYVVGEVDGRDVSVFILPKDRLGRFPHEDAVLRQVDMHHCQEAGYEMVLGAIDQNVVLVVGRSPVERLERVLKAYGTYPEHHEMPSV